LSCIYVMLHLTSDILAQRKKMSKKSFNLSSIYSKTIHNHCMYVCKKSQLRVLLLAHSLRHCDIAR
jgi:hypothetical protein